MTEEWRDIAGYEGLYQVSNTGYVRSLDRIKPDGRRQRGRYMKTSYDACGYEYVSLSKHNKAKKVSVHRLVAIAFIPNPDGLPQVNHKDEVRNHNSADNLEWCTFLYNQNYGNRKTRTSIASTGENNPRHILTEQDVREIRRTYIPGDAVYGKRGLSNKYKVKYVTITKIVTNQLWKHLLMKGDAE